MSLRQEYDSILKTYVDTIEHSSLRQDSSEYQSIVASTIERLLKLKTTVYTQLALFSKNESAEDISTASLKFLSIDYYLASMCSRKQMTSSQFSDPMDKNRMKLKFLEKSVQLFMQFLISLQDFEILDSYLTKKIDSFENSYKPTLKELYVQPTSNNDLSSAQLKRQQKIEMYRQSKATNEKLAFLETKIKKEDDGLDNDVDEKLRELYMEKMKSLSYEAFNSVEQTLYEIELLTNFTENPSSSSSAKRDDQHKDAENFTDKLETLNKPLLSKEGKVLRNFTLIDKRTELQSKVRGYGQYGPTMSVEEFLDKEFEEGRVLQGGDETKLGNKQDEDNSQWQDEQTYKARYWDEFKEANPKGSGNTMNRG